MSGYESRVLTSFGELSLKDWRKAVPSLKKGMEDEGWTKICTTGEEAFLMSRLGGATVTELISLNILPSAQALALLERAWRAGLIAFNREFEEHLRAMERNQGQNMLDRRVSLKPHFSPQKAEVLAYHMAILGLVDQPTPVKDLVSLSGLGQEKTMEAIREMWEKGMVEVEGMVAEEEIPPGSIVLVAEED